MKRAAEQLLSQPDPTGGPTIAKTLLPAVFSNKTKTIRHRSDILRFRSMPCAYSLGSWLLFGLAQSLAQPLTVPFGIRQSMPGTLRIVRDSCLDLACRNCQFNAQNYDFLQCQGHLAKCSKNVTNAPKQHVYRGREAQTTRSGYRYRDSAGQPYSANQSQDRGKRSVRNGFTTRHNWPSILQLQSLQSAAFDGGLRGHDACRSGFVNSVGKSPNLLC
jgi:hypothetical protein